MKILVTGANGYLGQGVVKALLDNGHSVVAADFKTNYVDEAESDQWTTDMLRCLFRNPTYTGAAANGSRQIIAENCHEPYITKEQFYAFPCNMREGENKISMDKSMLKSLHLPA
jgi:hypothetical protein